MAKRAGYRNGAITSSLFFSIPFITEVLEDARQYYMEINIDLQ
jgi:hypothetical protein